MTIEMYGALVLVISTLLLIVSYISHERAKEIDKHKQTIASYRWYTLAMKEKFPRQVEEFENSIVFEDLPNVTNILNDRIEEKKEVKK